MSTPTAAWSTTQLVDALARASWGPWDGKPGGGIRSCLRAVVALVDYRTGAGKITAAQVADAAGITSRWARRCLHVLEDAGVITWSRGWLDKGRPRPGHVRINKRALAALVRMARPIRDAKENTRRRSLAGRLANLRTGTIPPRGRTKPLATTAELRTDLPPLRGDSTPRVTPPTHHHPPGEDDMPGTTQPTLCAVCSRWPENCEKAQRGVPRSQRHAYVPTPPRNSRALIAPIAPPPAATHPAPKGWRSEARPAHPTLLP